MKLKKAGVLAVTSLILLSACGKDVSEKETVKIGDILKNTKEEKVSFDVYSNDDNKVDKNSSVERIIFTKDGKVKVYNMPDNSVSMMDVVDKDNKEIEKIASKNDKEYFNEQKEEELDKKVDNDDGNSSSTKSRIKSLEEDVKELNEEIAEAEEKENADSKDYEPLDRSSTSLEIERDEIQEDIDELKNSSAIEEEEAHEAKVNEEIKEVEKIKYKAPEYRDLKIKVVTDGTGNNTESEKLYLYGNGFTASDDENRTLKVYETDSKTLNKYFTEFTVTAPIIEIKDSKFAGLEDRGEFIITKVGDDTEGIKFDSPDDDYIDDVEE